VAVVTVRIKSAARMRVLHVHACYVLRVNVLCFIALVPLTTATTVDTDTVLTAVTTVLSPFEPVENTAQNCAQKDNRVRTSNNKNKTI
jgi:hypothetical protein